VYSGFALGFLRLMVAGGRGADLDLDEDEAEEEEEEEEEPFWPLRTVVAVVFFCLGCCFLVSTFISLFVAILRYQVRASTKSLYLA
jgi:hypothetical protein